MCRPFTTALGWRVGRKEAVCIVANVGRILVVGDRVSLVEERSRRASRAPSASRLRNVVRCGEERVSPPAPLPLPIATQSQGSAPRLSYRGGWGGLLRCIVTYICGFSLRMHRGGPAPLAYRGADGPLRLSSRLAVACSASYPIGWGRAVETARRSPWRARPTASRSCSALPRTAALPTALHTALHTVLPRVAAAPAVAAAAAGAARSDGHRRLRPPSDQRLQVVAARVGHRGGAVELVARHRALVDLRDV